MNNNISERKKRIFTDLSVLLVIVLIILLVSCTGHKQDNVVYVYKPKYAKKSENKFVKALKIPFFYILEYPKIIMGLSSDEGIEVDSSESSQKSKQFIKF